jgi:elongator complex protein 3
MNQKLLDYKLFLEKLKDKELNIKEINELKLSIAKHLNLERILSNPEILSILNAEEKKAFLSFLQLKKVRSISGVNIVAVMAAPYKCPHGKCAYCPSEPGIPESYTGHEPSSMRGLQYNFDPYLQTLNRIKQLIEIGHLVSKVELIIQGGTFPAMPISYQKDFVKGCLEAIIGEKTSSLNEAKNKAEKSKIRNVGLTIETRPDWCKQKHIDLMLELGATRVEIGVQTLYDDVYKLIERGHTVRDVIDAFRAAKDSGLKIVAHMMPGLPGCDFERDLKAFQALFEDSNFKPDMLKIYPCLVLKNTKLYEWWKEGKFNPYSTEEALELITRVKANIPKWVRIMRIQRDIPAKLIVAGVKKSNLRELAQEKLREKGLKCNCIRCREIGHKMLKENVKPEFENIQVNIEEYEASEGIELFISIDEPSVDALIGYLRLRIPSEKIERPELMDEETSIVRELKVCGPVVPLGEHFEDAWQHKGLGAKLLFEAEKISLEKFDCKKILVLSGLGVKPYYKRLGYYPEGPYIAKKLS